MFSVNSTLDLRSGGSRVGLGGAIAPQTLKLAPPNTKMLHTQKGKTIAKIDILAPSKICIYKVSPPKKISSNRHWIYAEFNQLVNSCLRVASMDSRPKDKVKNMQ